MSNERLENAMRILRYSFLQLDPVCDKFPKCHIKVFFGNSNWKKGKIFSN
jgi:hypothetical protein